MKNGGEVVLVTAAAGGTGQFAVQLAKLAGNRVIATCGNPKKKAILQELGAERVINYKVEDVQKVLKEEYPRGVSLVYDGVGGTLLQNILPCVSPLGRIVTIGAISTYNSDQSSALKQEHMQSLYERGVSILGFYLPMYARQFQEHLNELYQLYSSKKLRVHVDVSQNYSGLERAVDAVKHLHSGQSEGKVVLQIPEHVPTRYQKISEYKLKTSEKHETRMERQIVTSKQKKAIDI